MKDSEEACKKPVVGWIFEFQISKVLPTTTFFSSFSFLYFDNLSGLRLEDYFSRR